MRLAVAALAVTCVQTLVPPQPRRVPRMELYANASPQVVEAAKNQARTDEVEMSCDIKELIEGG